MLVGEDKTNEENVLILRHVDGSCTGEAFLFFYQSVFYLQSFIHIFCYDMFCTYYIFYVNNIRLDFRVLTRCYEI